MPQLLVITLHYLAINVVPPRTCHPMSPSQSRSTQAKSSIILPLPEHIEHIIETISNTHSLLQQNGTIIFSKYEGSSGAGTPSVGSSLIRVKSSKQIFQAEQIFQTEETSRGGQTLGSNSSAF